MINNKDQKTVSNHTFYYVNETLTPEIIPGWCPLYFLYFNPLGKLIRKIIRCRWVARLSAWFYSTSRSRSRIKHFIKAYRISMDDYEKPANEYSSFNDFFIRKLKPGVRPINPDPSVIISPADSKLYVIDNISVSTTFFVKQTLFDLDRFLGDSSLAREFYNGNMMIFRLAPNDYHRFHFPTDCVPLAPKPIHGTLESVMPFVYKSGHQPLLENERHIIMLQTEKFGPIAMVPVGAMIVGKIVETYMPNKKYLKGEEAGYFAFGGSTVVLLFKQGVIRPLPAFTKHSLQGFETAVKMGESLNE